MSNPSPLPNLQVVETAQGVCYRFPRPTWNSTPLILTLAVVTLVPVAAAGLAVVFLVRHGQQIAWPLLLVWLLFVVQMLFVARPPASLLARNTWEALAGALGHFEVELRDGWLLSGSHVGPVRRGGRWAIRDLRRVCVYWYIPASLPSANNEPAVKSEDQRVWCLALEFAAVARVILVGGYSRSETLALAEDLQRRVKIAAQGRGTQLQLPHVTVEKSTEAALYPNPLNEDFFSRMKPSWLVLHLAGAAGLVTLSLAVWRTEDAKLTLTRIALAAAWGLELFLFWMTIYLGRLPKAENDEGRLTRKD